MRHLLDAASRESSPETDTSTSGRGELSPAQARPFSSPTAFSRPPFPGQDRQMARLIWAAAARRGAAVATSTPVLIDIPPGKPKRICPCPALGGHRGKGSALEVFTEGEEQGEHGPRRADVEGGCRRVLPKTSRRPYKDNWRGAAHNQQQWQCRQRKLTTEKTERDRDQGREGGCVNPRGVSLAHFSPVR